MGKTLISLFFLGKERLSKTGLQWMCKVARIKCIEVGYLVSFLTVMGGEREYMIFYCKVFSFHVMLRIHRTFCSGSLAFGPKKKTPTL